MSFFIEFILEYRKIIFIVLLVYCLVLIGAFYWISKQEKSIPVPVDKVVYLKDLEDLNSRLELQKRSIDLLLKTKTDDVSIQTINIKIKALEASLTNLENAILTNPEKALSIPMLKQEIKKQNEMNDQYYAHLKSENDKIYILMGLIATFVGGIFITILTMAINNFFQKKNTGITPI